MANYKGKYRIKNAGGSYDTYWLQTHADQVIDNDGKTLSAKLVEMNQPTIKIGFNGGFTFSNYSFYRTFNFDRRIKRCRFEIDLSSLSHALQIGGGFAGSLMITGTFDFVNGANMNIITKSGNNKSYDYATGFANKTPIATNTSIRIEPHNASVVTNDFEGLKITIYGAPTTNQALSSCEGTIYVYPF